MHGAVLQETKGILRARKLGIKTPTVYLVDQQTNSILMEKVRGITVKDWLREGNYTEQDLEKVLTDIGKQVAILHDGGLVHGDLTTSNMIIGEGGSPRKKHGCLFFTCLKTPWFMVAYTNEQESL